MSKFVQMTDTKGRPVIVNLDKVLYVEQGSDYLVIVFGKSGDMRITQHIRMTMADFLSLASDKA